MRNENQKIRIPIYVDIETLKTEILTQCPELITKPNYLQRWVDRCCLFMYQIQRGVENNRMKYKRDNLSSIDNIPLVQIPKSIRELILSRKDKSDYYTRIVEELLFEKYVKKEQFYYEKEERYVDFYISKELCKQYYFIEEPNEYKEYVIQKAIISNKIQKIRELQSISKDLNDKQNDIRKLIFDNTDRVKIEITSNSIDAVSEYLTNIQSKQDPKKWIELWNENHVGSNRVDSFSQRSHHKMSNLKKTILPYCYDSSNKLVGLDIANSQLFFLSILSKDLIKRLVKNNNELKYLLKLNPLLDKYCNRTDFTEFKRLCVEGGLYEYMMEKYDSNITRDEVKKASYRVFFSDYREHFLYQGKSRRRVDVIKQTFPSVYHFMREVQQSIDFGLSQLKDHNTGFSEKYLQAAFLLQKLESVVMYDYVCPLFIDNTFATTIHDSLIIHENDVEKITTLFKQGFINLGVNPPVIKLK